MLASASMTRKVPRSERYNLTMSVREASTKPTRLYLP
jgi:hypothetical protein